MYARLMNQKGVSLILILLGVAVVIGLAVGIYYLGKFQPPKSQTQNRSISQTPQPTPVISSSDETANWKIYTSQKFGFSMKYPNDWIVKEDGNNGIWVSNTNDETLIIGVKNATDTVKITKSGTVVVKDLVKRGDVEFLQQLVEKNVLVFKGDDMSVMYDQAREIPRGNLVFTLSLDKTIVCPASINAPCPKILSSTSESIADKILSTFTFLNQNQFK